MPEVIQHAFFGFMRSIKSFVFTNISFSFCLLRKLFLSVALSIKMFRKNFLNFFTIALAILAYLKRDFSYLQIRLVFRWIAMFWQSGSYEIQGKWQCNITLKSIAICIKLLRNLPHFVVYSDSSYCLICLKSQFIMNGVACKRNENETVEVLKWLCSCVENGFLFLFGVAKRC